MNAAADYFPALHTHPGAVLVAAVVVTLILLLAAGVTAIKGANTSGMKGVTFRADYGKYQARIRTGGEKITIGSFLMAQQAHQAYLAAARSYFGEFADDYDRVARVALVAAAIPPDVDLDDEADVVRALFLARFCGADVADVLTEAIGVARDYRKAAPHA